ncbi:hypothetical protein WJX81_007271 [Elliptochloris bilobata]|uniref:HIT domain-containing protein n=1 Tax=Elliptochloris bilobata TaxID=381761 RepID=A0AAW1RY90_9CHLO
MAVLLLIGPPGSGKSTFCERLMQHSSLAWRRVNQDTIANGRRGSRAACVAAQRDALRQGACVAVDRCNFDEAQRADFVAAAVEASCAVHALWLNLPAVTCAARAAARVGHEGGLEGAAATPASLRMHAQAAAAPPRRSEGLATIRVCNNDAEVDMALEAWAAFGTPGAPDPAAALPPSPLARLWGRAAAPQAAGAKRAPVGRSAAGEPRTKAARLGAVALSSMAPGDNPVGSGGVSGGSDAVADGSGGDSGRGNADAGGAGGSGPTTGGWSQSLRDIALHPERHAAVVLAQDAACVLIRDKYPKARRHALVLPRITGLDSAADLTRAHLPLLARMQAKADAWVAEQRSSDPTLPNFAVGFHSVPSMAHLHLHVISTDYDSACLKTKRHWNSFTSAFFLHLRDRSMPALKNHLRSHGR